MLTISDFDQDKAITFHEYFTPEFSLSISILFVNLNPSIIWMKIQQKNDSEK